MQEQEMMGEDRIEMEDQAVMIEQGIAHTLLGALYCCSVSFLYTVASVML